MQNQGTTELETGEVSLFGREYRGVQPFVHVRRECNTPVQVKGGSLVQKAAFRHLVLVLLDAESRKGISFAALLPCRGNQKKRRNSCEINKAQWTSWKEWRL